MSDNINTMNFKQLKNEVQSLRDELAIMKRKYEDIIYNLDTDNFSSRFVKEQGDMRTAIEITAEGIKTKVSNEEFESEKVQTANLISSEVKKLSDEDTALYTKIAQTENNISFYVEEYVTNTLDNKDYVTNANFQLTANEIRATVSANYNSLSGDIDDVWSYASNINQTANSISTRVGKVENGQYTQNNVTYTLFTQTADTFEFNGKYMLMNSAIKLTDNTGNHSFSIFHNEGDGIRGTYIGASGHNLTDPLFLGSSTQKVYLYDIGDDNLIATHGWVLENAGSGGTGGYAVFG